jgi:hypothetical protein
MEVIGMRIIRDSCYCIVHCLMEDPRSLVPENGSLIFALYLLQASITKQKWANTFHPSLSFVTDLFVCI